MAPPHGTRCVWIALLTVLTPLLLCTAPASATPRIIYVDDDAPLGGNGATWPTAYRFLQDALAVQAADLEIHVAQGTYYPDRDTAHPNGTTDRHATFSLRNNLALRGGYAGLNTPNPDARDIDAYVTTLSGNIGEFEVDDNCCHVVTATQVDDTARLEGCLVSGGNGKPDPDCPNTVGAGLSLDRSSPTIGSCTFRDNIAGPLGGGSIGISSGSPTLTGCKFTNNQARGDTMGGAGILNSGGHPSLVNCSFISNTASAFKGGAGFCHLTGDVSLSDCMFTNNIVDNEGGGGLYIGGGSATLTRCNFTANMALANAEGGGGILVDRYAICTVTDCSFERNQATGTPGVGGGLANIWSSTVVLTNCTFAENFAAHEGAGYYSSAQAPNLTSCNFRHNRAGYAGGGLANRSGPPGVLDNCTFVGNSAGTNSSSDAFGGGVVTDGSLLVSNCTFIANSVTAQDAKGGGWFSEAGAPLLTNCSFTSNVVEGHSAYGGASYNRSGTPVLIDCTFTRNAATGDFAGGGALYNSVADSTFTNCAFLANRAEGSQESRGGAICVGDGQATLTTCTSTDNTALGSDGQAGGLYNFSGNPTLTNCIFWNDEPNEFSTLNSNLTVTHTDIAGGHPGPGNINANPLFMDPLGPDNQLGTGDEDLRLRPGSPCIDSGDNDALPPTITTDIAGRPRFTDDPATPDTGVGTPPIIDMGANEYQPGDCNDNAIPDADDIAAGTSRDCNANAIPDECSPLYYNLSLFIAQLLTDNPQPHLVCLFDTNSDSILDGADIPGIITRLTTR